MQQLLDDIGKPGEGLKFFRHDGQIEAFLLHDTQGFRDQVGVAIGQPGKRRRIQVIQGVLNRFGDALDIYSPTGQFRGEAGVLTFTPDREGQLVFRHENHCGLAIDGVVVEVDACDTGRAQCLGDEGDGIGVPFDDIDLLVMEFLDDVLDANAAHADAGADGVNAVLQRGDGDFRAVARFTSNVFDFHLAVIDLGHFVFQQPS